MACSSGSAPDASNRQPLWATSGRLNAARIYTEAHGMTARWDLVTERSQCNPVSHAERGWVALYPVAVMRDVRVARDSARLWHIVETWKSVPYANRYVPTNESRKRWVTGAGRAPCDAGASIAVPSRALAWSRSSWLNHPSRRQWSPHGHPELPPWHANVGKRLIRSQQVYVRDSGIAHALLGIGSADALLGYPSSARASRVRHARRGGPPQP